MPVRCRARLLPLCLALALLAGACRPGERDPGEPPPAPEASNRFDPAGIQVGDRILGLTVTRQDLSHAPAMGDSVYVGSVEFSGELTLSGSYRAHPDYPEVQALCFDVDEASAARVPRMRGDERRVWFCFDNQEEAVRALGSPGTAGRATIVIDDYRTVRQFTDAFDTATLLRVVE
ncbi:hypothetical protein BH20GEM2_BH20GEM2_08590 [soil metagenome]